MDLSHIEALSFDCYGTLIDWERGLLSILGPWAAKHGLQVSDDRLLEVFSQYEPLCQAAEPKALYPDILRRVHARMAEHLGVPGCVSDAEIMASSIRNWSVYGDVPAALRQLKQKYKLLILSNIDRASFAYSNEKLGVTFDAIITAEDVGSYKPADGHFRRALTLLNEMDIGREGVLHVAQSLFHDHVPAQALGLATVWVDRRRGKTGSGATPRPRVAITPDLVVPDIAELQRCLNASFI